jgi:hypothetical protein
MSGPRRLLLVAAAVAAAVLAFVLLKPGGDGEGGSRPAATAGREPTRTGARPDTALRESRIERVQLRGARPVGGPRRVEVARGDTVRIVIAADAPDELHLHSYDVTRVATPGRPARFTVRADAEGEFELESHTAEDAGLEPRVLTLVVRPS